jgi:hypothetical protein
MSICRASFVCLATILLAGCVAASPEPPPAVAPTAAAQPSTTPNPTVRPTPIPPTATPTAEPIRSPLADFPFNLGNEWIYSYEASWDGGQAEFQVSLEVMETQEQGSQFAAKIGVTALLLSGSTDAPFMLPASTDFWYVVDGGNVYRENETLSFPTADNFGLEYVFPLQGSWCPQHVERLQSNCNNDRVVFEGPESKETPAGQIPDCYLLVTHYTSGPTLQWYCLGTGIVAEEYHHNGTQFDSKSVLTEYTLHEP